MSKTHGRPQISSTDSDSDDESASGSDSGNESDSTPSPSLEHLEREADRSPHVVVDDGELACNNCGKRFPGAESRHVVLGHLESGNCPEYVPTRTVNRSKPFEEFVSATGVSDTADLTELGREFGIENAGDEANETAQQATEAQAEIEAFFEKHREFGRFAMEKARAEAEPGSLLDRAIPTPTEQGEYRGPLSTVAEWKVFAVGVLLGLGAAASPAPFETFVGPLGLGLGFAGGKGQRLMEIHEDSASFLIGLLLAFAVALFLRFITGMPIPGPSIPLG